VKIALLSDIHANFLALEAVLEAVRAHGVETIWFLGDITDRGPNPVETTRWLQEEIHRNPDFRWVMGNHDAMLANLPTEKEWRRINPIHRADNARHRRMLEAHPEAWAFVSQEFSPERLSPRPHTVDSALFMMVHGGLVDPAGYYRYLYPWWEPPLYIQVEFDELKRRTDKEDVAIKAIVCGHTHVQTLIAGGSNQEQTIRPVQVRLGEQYPLLSENLWLINPGSVGQPRDLDRRAAYAILETGKTGHFVTFYRQEYDWRETARQLVQQGADSLYVEILRDATPDRDTPATWLEEYKQRQAE